MGKKTLIKLAVSFIMLFVVFRLVNFQELKATLLSIPYHVIILVTVFYSLGQLLSSYKWWCLATNSLNVSYLITLRAYFIGMYVNCFGLGTVGGDVARGLLISAGKGTKTEALASVIADRAHGLAVLALIGILSVYALEHDKIDFALKLFLLGSAILICVGWVVGPSLLLKLTPKNNKYRSKIERVSAQFPRSWSKLGYITLISVLFHSAQILTNGYMIRTLGIDVSWPMIFAAIPFVNILGTLPISWQGLGVRELSLVFFFHGHVSSEQALALGALWFLATTVSSGIGGIIAALSGDLKTFRDLKAELLESRSVSKVICRPTAK